METFFKNLTPEEDTAEKLLRDLNMLREDTEELFRATGGKLAEKSKEKFLTAVEKVKAACHDIQDKAHASERNIREYPYSAVSIAFGLGLIFGVMVLGRRSKTHHKPAENS
jgi:ElaB/YqjD/DUF883 family membrane-anchored ribosome-binding protein